MRVGIVSPIVTLFPGAHADWEADAGIAELAGIAADADALGYEFLTCSEHVAVPTEVAATRGGTYWDPLSTFGFLAARTSRIRFATQVLVLGYHHPLEIAKRYGTLDLISGGRLVLGVGVGSLRAEFDLLGAEFDGRGARADEAMVALRAALSQPEPSHHGEFYEFDDIVVRPHALAPRVPLWVGGRSARSLRRAIELGDGWVPFALGRTELTAMLADRELPAGFDVVLTASDLDPIADADRTRHRLGTLSQAGATAVAAGLRATSAGHYREQLAALAELVDLTAPIRPGVAS
ncbi:LLM class F420-dependent oxidoreductase [Gordonia sp. ABSL1-1]|uniref:LLM class F420-dependent oxidoreductase n=1 Tax=Gordonia sp. ABSL1-1 TaxID=3053923 RepID=UPI0025732709|nr:LLM class F420-dependent oxidoreductase [Gordonia sp. ABSL1-1]MDL9938061.1 LLM class F420-dependent oxidoreductase [Gordonia sp. ABSL1-1]